MSTDETVAKQPKKKFYKKPWFWLLIIVIFAIGMAQSPTDEPNNNNIDNQKQQDSEQQNDDTQKVLTEDEKNALIQLDGQIFKIVTDCEATTTSLQSYLTAFSEQNATLLDVYNAAKTAKDTQFNYWGQLQDLQNDTNKDYIEACQIYVGIHQSFAENLMKYLDKNEIKYLSKAQEDLESTSNYAYTVVAARMSWLANQGLTTDEISAILSPTEE